MADAQSKLTIFFNAHGSSPMADAMGTPSVGWTETFYSALSSLTSLILVGKNYADKRSNMLGVGATVMYLRASTIPPNRLTRVFFYRGNSGQGDIYTKVPQDAYDPTQVDLLCRMEAVNGKRRMIWIAGLPDSLTSTAKSQGVDAAFINDPPFKQWVNFIKTNQLSMRFKETAGPPPTFGISSIIDIIPVMMRKRNRGRPFYLFRGRRQA